MNAYTQAALQKLWNSTPAESAVIEFREEEVDDLIYEGLAYIKSTSIYLDSAAVPRLVLTSYGQKLCRAARRIYEP